MAETKKTQQQKTQEHLELLKKLGFSEHKGPYSFVATGNNLIPRPKKAGNKPQNEPK
jgi:hypothetical protein